MAFPKFIYLYFIIFISGMLLLPVVKATEKKTECYEISQNELAGFYLHTEISHRKRLVSYEGKMFANDEEYFRRTMDGKTEEILILKNGVTLYKGVAEESLLSIPGPFYGIAYSFMPAHSVVSKLNPQDVCNGNNNGIHLARMNQDRDDSTIIEVQAKFKNNRLEYQFTANRKKTIKGFIGFTIPEPIANSMSLQGWSIVKDGKIIKNKSYKRLSQLRSLNK